MTRLSARLPGRRAVLATALKCAVRLRPAAGRQCAVALAFAALALGLSAPSGIPASAANASAGGPSVLVETIPVRRGTLPQIVRAYGTVQASSSAREAVAVTLTATVAAVYVRVGEEVAQGAPLLRLVPTPEALAAYAQAVSALRVATDLVKRTTELLGQHLATRQQLASAEKGAADAHAALAALRSQGAAGPTTLRARFPAIVTQVSTNVNATALPGTALLELVRPNALILDVGVTPGDASRVERGDPASVKAIGGSRALSAQVLMRGAVVDAGTGLVPVQVSLPAGSLLPGQWAQAAITVGEVQGFVVPHAAILVDDNGDTYVVQAPRGVARIVRVNVLAADGSQDTVSGPLDLEAPLVLSGNYQLQNGMKVRLPDPSPKRSR